MEVTLKVTFIKKKIQINVKIIHQFNYLRKWRWEFLVLLMTIMERRKRSESLIECMWGEKDLLKLKQRSKAGSFQRERNFLKYFWSRNSTQKSKLTSFKKTEQLWIQGYTTSWFTMIARKALHFVCDLWVNKL